LHRHDELSDRAMTGSRPVIPPPVAPPADGPEQPELHHAAATDIPIEELAERYQDGATLAEIAARYQLLGYTVNPDEIRHRLIAVGIQIKLIDHTANVLLRRGKRGTANLPLSSEELAERYRAGASLDDLAILCRCSSSKIRRTLAAAGVVIQPRGGRNGTPGRS
ncbi:hypothetical protein, partial [Skermanella aerolata]